MYALIQGGAVAQWPISNLRAAFPQTSFPEVITSKALPSGVVEVEIGQMPAFDPRLESVTLGSPILSDGKWTSQYEVTPLPQEELNARHALVCADVRAQRDDLLRASDWTQGRDIPEAISTPWGVYRQALRDVTSQPGFPSDIEWPQAPSNMSIGGN